MAYFQKNNNNEDQNQNQNTTSNTGGNTYSVSSSEVSSTVDNNENNKKSDTGSGNFVNLTKYLDSNQGKMENYANTFVQDDLNKGKDYQGNIQNAQDKYLSSIKSDNAYTYNSNSDNKLLDNYLRNSSSVSDSDKQRASNILKGYQGADYWSNTGDEFNYNNLKKGSEDFNTLSGNITNQDYLKTKMSNDLSSGGKSLDSFLLGASDNSKNVLNNASNQFSELASLLDSTSGNLNTQRDTVVNKANENQQAFDKARQDKTKELENLLQSQYDVSKKINDRILEQNKNLTNILNLPSEAIRNDGYYNYYKDLSRQAKDNLNTELAELRNRSNALTGVSPLQGDSKLDFNLNSYEFVAPTDQQKQEQALRSNVFNTIVSDPSIARAVPSEVLASLQRAYMLDEINVDELKNKIFEYKKNYYNY